MEKHFTLPIFVVLAGLIMSFSVISDYRVEKKTAEVQQISGVYIFFCAEPVLEHKFLGSITVQVTWDSETDTRIHAAIKKAKKKYPYCDAIIFRDMDLATCDCIKFNENE